MRRGQLLDRGRHGAGDDPGAHRGGCPAVRSEVFGALLHRARWVEVYFSWRPNLSDEGDNHLIELAVAGGAEALVTRNIADFKRAELKFPDLAILTPDQFLEVHPCQP